MQIRNLIAGAIALGLTPALLVGCSPSAPQDVPIAAIAEPDTGAAPQEAAESGSGAEDATGADSAYPGQSPMSDDSSITGAYPGGSGSAPAGGEAAAAVTLNTTQTAIPLTGTIAFNAHKVTRDHHVVFRNWQGTLYPGDGSPGSARLEFEATVDSLISDPDDRGMMSDRLDNHLRSEDFFEVATYPTARFVSTTITEGGEGGATHTVTGDLTIRDVTKTITFPVTVAAADGKVSASTEFRLDRQEFGLSYPGAPDDLIADEVVMVIELEGAL